MTAGIAVLTGLSIWGQYQGQPVGALLGLDLVVGVASCVLVPVALLRPVPGALALAVLAGTSVAATPAATMGTLMVAQRRRAPVAVAVAAVGVLAHAVRGVWRPVEGLSLAWWLVLVVVAHAALLGWGRWRAARRALIASLRERVRRAEAEQGRRVAEARALERRRIAHEMHDVLAHRLSLLATYAGALEYRPDAAPENLARAAGVIRGTVSEALGDLRDVIAVLRDDEPPGESVGDRPQPALADLPELIAQSAHAGTRVSLDDRLARRETLPAASGRTTYRILQEALTNARKHAAGQSVNVLLDGAPGDRLTIEVRNPLAPDRDAAPLVPGGGYGLVGLTERVRLAGGQLDHQVTAAGEFQLRAWLPWPA
ncbi:MAG TPA: histidine kinase [Micromonosporaceae bacterium]